MCQVLAFPGFHRGKPLPTVFPSGRTALTGTTATPGLQEQLGNYGQLVVASAGPDNGETETDLLYSRLVTPFWNFQMGVQYANEWNTDDYNDRWSGVIGFQGLAPYKFELDNALYVSEDGDVTFACEAEYDLRITQRLML